MKIKIYESGDEINHKPKRKFAILPTIAADTNLNNGKYLVFLEWLVWNSIYESWTITPSTKSIKQNN